MRATKTVGLAAAVVLALFIGFGAPAAATAPIEVTSGTLNTVLGSFDLTPGSQGTPPCPDKASTLRFTTTANPNRWTLVGNFTGQFQLPPASGNWYQADFAILNGSGGTWSGAAPTQGLLGTIGVRVTIHQIQLAGGPVDCTKSNLRCIITGAFTVQATSTYKAAAGAPGLPTTTTGDMATLDANTASPLVVSSCTAPWNSVAGTAATIVNLQATIL